MTAATLLHHAEERRRYERGATVYRAGERGDCMFGIMDGAVELRKGDVTVTSLVAGDMFGQRALIDGLPRNLTAVATVDTELAVVDHTLFLFLVHETPLFALEVMGALASRLRDYDDVM